MIDFSFGIVDMVRFWARVTPDEPAIIQSGMIVTYQALANGIDSVSARIRNFGLDTSEPVAVALTYPSATLATAFALLELGYDVASVNRTLFPYLRSAGVNNLIYDSQGQVLSGGRNIRFEANWLQTSAATPSNLEAQYRSTTTKPGDMIFFTSGTTGLPKKIKQTASALEELLRYPITAASGTHKKVLIMPTLVSTFGFNRACEILNAGKTALFAPGTEAALSLACIFEAELIICSAAQAGSLADLKKKNPGYELGSLETLHIGGGTISAARLAEIRSVLCRNCLSRYGSTEAGFVASASFESIASTPGAVGYILPWATIEIVDEHGALLPPGEEGVIRYRTPQLMHNIAAANADEFPGLKDQWFYPGDIGRVTADGLLCVGSRTNDVINRGGVKVSSKKIEEVLEALPDIKEAAACGVIGASGFEEIWIALVSDGPRELDVEKIKKRLKDHDEINILPDELFVLDELPRGDVGKIQKHRLREVMLDKKKASNT